MDADGVDLYFLNRDPVRNVKDIKNILPVFNTPPYGLTPLSRLLRQILAAKKELPFDRKLLILIATDG